MTNILHQEIQKALNTAQYSKTFDDVEYDFTPVKVTLQANPHLVNTADNEGNTLLHILCKIVDDNSLVYGLTVENVLAFKPNPLVQNKAGHLPIDYLKEKSKSFNTLKNYHKHYNQMACFTSQLFGKTTLSKEEQAFHDEITATLLSYKYNKSFDMAEYDFSKVYQALQSNPKLINAQNKEGDTVLHIFCKVANDSLVTGLNIDQLLSFKPNPFLMNKNGYSPLNYLTNVSQERTCLKIYQNQYKKTNVLNLVFHKFMNRQNG